MAEYRYRGPGPEEHDGELARPGDVREFDAEPGWGLWERTEPEPPAGDDDDGLPGKPTLAPGFAVPPATAAAAAAPEGT